MTHGKQIRLFLMDGSPSGMRYAELVNWTGQAFACPSGFFSKLKEWTETQRPGVYVLLGVDAQGEDIAYVGESENVAQRLLTHVKNSTLEEIVEAFFFTSKDDNLTKGHITYLEKQLIARATSVNRYPLKNDVTPSDKVLSKPELATMQEFLDCLYLVAESLGYDVFVNKSKVSNAIHKAVFYSLDVGGTVVATGNPTEEGFVVYAGSKAKSFDLDSLKGGYQTAKDDLKKSGVLVPDANPEFFVFTQDYLFKSSSAAASVIAGHQKGGPASWKRTDGKYLKQVEAEEAGMEVNQLISE